MALIHPSVELTKIFMQANRGACEVTLNDLILAGELDDRNALDAAGIISSFLTDYGLDLVPDIRTGNLATLRLLRSNAGAIIFEDNIRSEISEGECHEREFKSSLYYDYARAAAQDDAKKEELKSEKVLFSNLKTIAGFLNADGGRLFIGIRDNGHPLGIESDFPFLKREGEPVDQWELKLRTEIERYFDKGQIINDHIQCGFSEIDGKVVAIITVSRRSSISCVRNPKSAKFEVYRRQGNRTVAVQVRDMEEFVKDRINSVDTE